MARDIPGKGGKTGLKKPLPEGWERYWGSGGGKGRGCLIYNYSRVSILRGGSGVVG